MKNQGQITARKDPMPTPEQEIAILEKAADFADYQWCQRFSALDAAGIPVHIDNPETARRCALGQLDWAIIQEGAAPILQMTLRQRLGEQLAAQSPEEIKTENSLEPYRIAEWNDAKDRTPAEVRQLFQATLQTLRQEANAAIPAAV